MIKDNLRFSKKLYFLIGQDKSNLFQMKTLFYLKAI